MAAKLRLKPFPRPHAKTGQEASATPNAEAPEAPAPEETPAEAAETAEAPVPEETHAETAEVAEAPVPEKTHAETAEVAEDPVPEETHAEVAKVAETAKDPVPAGMAADAPHTLVAHDLVKSYKGRTVVRGVTIHVDKGEVVGLLGPNGAGKTTSFYMILGLVRPDRGTIVFQGEDITRYPVYRRARAGLGYLAQEPSIFRKLTVEQNIWAILETTDLTREQRRARLDELLGRFDLTKVRKQYAYTLSGGERRKLEIARALVQNPSILMLDEPVAGVDPVAVEGIRSIVRDLRADGYGILITDHNVRETLSIVDRAYILIDGTVIKEGGVDEIVSDPIVRKEYLTDDFRM